MIGPEKCSYYGNAQLGDSYANNQKLNGQEWHNRTRSQ